mgnify:CR=1 FL=1
MNDKELKKLNRKELLEILLSQAKLIEELESELARTQKELNNKTIILKEAGSIAEATLRLSGIFEKAQEVADEYLNSIKESKDLLVKNEKNKKNSKTSDGLKAHVTCQKDDKNFKRRKGKMSDEKNN